MEANVTLNLIHVLIGFGMMVLTIIGMLTANRRHMEKTLNSKADLPLVVKIEEKMSSCEKDKADIKYVDTKIGHVYGKIKENKEDTKDMFASINSKLDKLLDLRLSGG